MHDLFPEYFRKKIMDEIREKEVWLGKGKADSHERYRQVTGEISGLQRSLEIHSKAMKAYGENEDE